jgi:hypothetical protein
MAIFDQRQQRVGIQYNIAGGDPATLRALLARAQLSEDELARALQKLSALPFDEIPEPTTLPPGSRVVFRHNQLFVGRTSDLRELARLLKGQETTAIGVTAVASGLGGIGKTQLASEFVHRYGQFFARSSSAASRSLTQLHATALLRTGSTAQKACRLPSHQKSRQ